MSDFAQRLHELSKQVKALSLESQCDDCVDWHVRDWLANAGTLLNLTAYRQGQIERGSIVKSSTPINRPDKAA